MSVLSTTLNRLDAAVRKRPDWLCVGLFLLVVWVFLPAIGFDYINYDDDHLLALNPQLQNSLSEGIRWALEMSFGNWHPVTMLTHVFTYHLFGPKPWSHHLVNILWHAANTLALFIAVKKMTGALWRSLLVALIFGLHPLRVESVAWVASRNDVVGTLFFFLSLWAYLRFLDRDKKTKYFYALSLFLFFLALASKPMNVTLPCVLLLVDFWPLNRWSKKNFRQLILEKIPYFALDVGACLLTVIARGKAHSMTTVGGLPLAVRAGNAVVSYGRYLRKLFWPSDLTLFYPYPAGWPLSTIAASVGLLVVVTLMVIVLRKRQPCLAMGWFWFLGTLAPVIGLVQAGSQSMADRYSYMPSVGISFMLIWGLSEWRGANRRVMPFFAGAAFVLVIGLSFLTRWQLDYWRNSETIWRRSIAVTPVNHLGTVKLADYLADQGVAREAETLYKNALLFMPVDSGTHNNLGLLLQSQGRDAEAIQHFQEAVKDDPNNSDAHLNLGAALSNAGREKEAAEHFEIAQKLSPSDASTWNNLGVTLGAKGRLDEAIKSFQMALRIDHKDASAWINLGFALEQKGRREEAITAYERALTLQPDHPLAREHLANIRAHSITPPSK